jgi:hypothetical protein
VRLQSAITRGTKRLIVSPTMASGLLYCHHPQRRMIQ